MDAAFWHRRWEARQIGFHEGAVNHLLEAHWPSSGVPGGARVFLPLCGKTRDIAWLLDQGHPVVGVELSEVAVSELFDELGVPPEVGAAGALRCYRADGLDIYVGDLFDLTAGLLGPVDAIYDRAALVALPPPMRTRYARHLLSLTGGVPQLLVTFEYDQTQLDGPPFSVDEAELRSLYADAYTIESLQIDAITDGFKGVEAVNRAWRLSRRV